MAGAISDEFVPRRTERILRRHYRELTAKGYSADELAEWVWGRRKHGKRERGDGVRLRRRLGIEPTPVGNGYPPKLSRITYDVAVTIGRALGLDPIDFGL